MVSELVKKRLAPKFIGPAILMHLQLASTSAISLSFAHSPMMDISSLVRVRDMNLPEELSVNKASNSGGMFSSGLSCLTKKGRSRRESWNAGWLDGCGGGMVDRPMSFAV